MKHVYDCVVTGTVEYNVQVLADSAEEAKAAAIQEPPADLQPILSVERCIMLDEDEA